MSKFIVITLTVLSRLLPHPPNFSFVGGYSTWAGQQSNPYLGSALVLGILFLTDFFLGFHDQITGVYAGFIAVFLMGRFFSGHLSQGSIAKNSIYSFFSSLVFFVISNLWVWWTTYPHSVNDLVNCFLLALPFFGYALAGDFTSTHLFITLPHRLRMMKPKPAKN